MERYLRATDYIDYDRDNVQKIIKDLDLSKLDRIEQVRKIFYFVKDSINYSVKSVSLEPSAFKASYTFEQSSSYCIPKAVALCTLGRAIGIPSRIHLVDFINHRLTDKLKELWGTDIMAPHAFTEVYVDDRWIKLTPALDRQTCIDHNFRQVEFIGYEDAMLHSTDLDGNLHVEYIKDHGTFDDLPLDYIKQVFNNVYGGTDLLEMFTAKVDTFK